MNMAKDDQSVTSKYAKSIFGFLLERIFMVLQNGKHYKRFITFARKGNEQAAADEFRIVWRVIAQDLGDARAPVTIDEAIEICKQFFFDPDDSQKDYSHIAVDILWEDAPSFLTFVRQRNELEGEEEFQIRSLELQNEFVREDLLRSMIQLAFLPSKLLPDSPHLLDRQKATFSENLQRLVRQYLPQSGIETSVHELRQLILSEIPKLQDRESFFDLLNDYAEELHRKEKKETEEHPTEDDVISLTEEVQEVTVSPPSVPVQIPLPPPPPPPPRIKEVKIPVVNFDHQSGMFRVGTDLIAVTPKGLLTAIGKIPFDLCTISDRQIEEFCAHVSSILLKVVESVRNSKERPLGGILEEISRISDMLFEVKEKLEPRYFKKWQNGMPLTPQEIKAKCIVDSLNLAESAANEMLPMSLRIRKRRKERIQIQ